MPMSRVQKNVMRSAKSPKEGTCATGDENSKSNMRGKQYNQNKSTPQKAKSYSAGDGGGGAGKLII